MIKKIKLVNWKTHKNSILEFSDGTNVIVGINGAGKSSIMDAISFALFGTFPKLQSRKQNLDGVITRKPIKAVEARVELDFSYENKDYRVMRVIEKGKGTTYSELVIKENGRDKLLEGPNAKRVTEMIQKILKLDYELFSRAIYSEQNAIDYFIELSPSERAKKIDNLLKIDDFERARSTTVSLKTKFEVEKSSLQKIVRDEDIENIKKEIQDLEKKIAEDELKIKESEREISETKNLIFNVETKIRDLESKKVELEKLKAKVENLKINLKEKLEKQNELKNYLQYSLDELNQKIENINQKIKIFENSYLQEKSIYETNLVEKTKKESERNGLIKRNLEIENYLKNIEIYVKIFEDLSNIYKTDASEILKDKRKQLEKINSDISILEYKKQEAEKISNQIERLENRCPVCNSEIIEDKKKHLLEHKKKEREEITKNLNVLLNEREILISEIEKIESDIKRISEAKKFYDEFFKMKNEHKENLDKIDEISKSLVSFEDKIRKLKESIEKLQKQIDEAKIEKTKLENLIEKIRELQKIENEIKHVELEIEINNRKINDLNELIEQSNFDNLKKEYEEKKEKAVRLSTILSEKEKLVAERKYILEKTKNEFEKLVEQKRYISKLEKILKNLSIFEYALEKTQKQLREEFIEFVNSKMSEIWQELYAYSDYIDIRLFVDEGNYILQLLGRDNEWVDVENVSGGECTMACLALRMAFSLALVPHLNWLILDEPTHNLDEKSVLSLNEVLKEKIKDFVNQVFIITHDRHLEGAASGELYRINRNKDEDDYSEIIRVTDV